jgi:hypothetical protein
MNNIDIKNVTDDIIIVRNFAIQGSAIAGEFQNVTDYFQTFKVSQNGVEKHPFEMLSIFPMTLLQFNGREFTNRSREYKFLVIHNQQLFGIS